MELARILPVEEAPPLDDAVGPAQLTISAVDDFLRAFGAAKEKRHGMLAGGKRVSRRTKDLLLNRALEVMSDEFSPVSLARIMSNVDLSMEAYARTLASIRDDRTADPKHRMAAADKLMQLLLTTARNRLVEESENPTSPVTDPSKLLEVMSRIRGNDGTGNQTGTQTGTQTGIENESTDQPGQESDIESGLGTESGHEGRSGADGSSPSTGPAGLSGATPGTIGELVPAGWSGVHEPAPGGTCQTAEIESGG